MVRVCVHARSVRCALPGVTPLLWDLALRLYLYLDQYTHTQPDSKQSVHQQVVLFYPRKQMALLFLAAYCTAVGAAAQYSLVVRRTFKDFNSVEQPSVPLNLVHDAFIYSHHKE